MGEDIISITHLSKGKRTQSLYSPKKRGTILPPEGLQFARSGSTSVESITAGETEDEQHPFFRPFGISSKYVLAYGLAVKGFLPELSPVSFLSRAEKENTETRMYRSATQRMALMLGSAVLFLLLLPIGSGQIIQTKINGMDEILLSSGTLYGEVAALEEQVKNLESRLDGRSPLMRGTNLSKILHDFAGVVPAGVSLTKLTVLNPNPPQAVLSLTGNAKSNEMVAELLRALQENVGFSEVSLVRSGSALQSVLPVGSLKDSPSVSFEIRATATY
jgi:Tfp pilus assembly protein PilN